MKRLNRLLRWSLAVATLAAMTAGTPGAKAQAVFGQILGTVTDSTGAAIPNATVVVKDVAKGTSVTVQSNGAGEFTVDHLIPDTYDVKVTAAGFKSFEQTSLALFADEAPKVTAVLGVGTSDQTVEVSASDIPQLKTDKVDVSTTFNAQEIEELPIPDHNFANLQLLLPGAVQLGWAHAADENPQGSKQIQIDGQAFGGVNYTLDGTDNQDAILGIIVINPNSDSMSETKLATQNFDAEFGKAVASVETVQTKSGSNAFHGTAFDNRESSANLARDPFVQSGGAPIPPGLKNQFGGSLGGPIFKDKLFFFGDYQGVRQKVGVSDLQTVPTANLVSTCLGQSVGTSGIAGCDFSEYVAQGAAIYEPGTTTPYPGNVIPTAMLSPTALKLFKLLQPYKPNHANATLNGLTQNYQGSGTGLFNSNQWDVRVDNTLSDRIHLFGRFSRFTDILSGSTMFGPAGGDGFGIGGYGGNSKGANDSLALGTDIVVNSKLVTDIRLGYYRYNIIDVKYDPGNTGLPIQGENISGTGPNAALTVGVDYGAPDINVEDPSATGLSSFSNSQGDNSQYGAGLNVDHCNCPLTEREDQFQVVNNWTKTIGNHSVKAGVDLRYARNLRIPSDNDRTGINNFDDAPTSNGSTGGLGFATYVLGDVTSFNRYASVATNAKEFQKRDFFYVQDTWRATPKLTLNLGMRYELYFPEDVNGKDAGALLNLQTGFINVAGEGPIGTNMGVAIAKNTYNPRLGVAYQMNAKTVIRAGYGRSFDLGVFGSEFGHVVTQNLPVLVNQSINATGGPSTYAFQLDNPASTQGGLATGLTNYVPVAANANGQIVNPGASVNTKARPFTERLPTLDAWNVAVQRSLTPTISVTASYVGNKGTHTLSDGDSNTTNPNEAGIFLPASLSSVFAGATPIALHYDNQNQTTSTGAPGPIPLYCAAAAGNCSQGVPLSGPYAGATNNSTLLQRYVGGSLPACQGPCGWTQGISYYGDDQDSHYNSLQLTGAKTFTHGLSVNANYAFAHARDNASSYATWNKASVIGNDSAVRRNAFTAYGLYKLPFGHNQPYLSHTNGFVNALVGGFEISPVVIFQSGLPFTLSYGECSQVVPGSAPCYVNGPSSALKTGKSGFAGGSGTSAPTWYAQQTLGSTFTAPALDTIGNGGRNNAWGPHFFNSDMSLLKNFTVREKYTAQFRVDAFNAFNHINYGNPGGNIEQPGSISSGPGPSGTTNPRQIELTARIQF
jgi:hypothetical protein